MIRLRVLEIIILTNDFCCVDVKLSSLTNKKLEVGKGGKPIYFVASSISSAHPPTP